MNSDLRVTTPEILWHGGGLLPGKPDPVLSIDMYREDILVTSGIDANIPPKGSIRLWKIGSHDSELQFLVDFSDHQDVVNVVRFSPCGKMIASASLGLIIVYYVPNPQMWRTIDDPKLAERIWLRPCLQEIYDLNWSPDSQFVIAGSIDSKGEILRVKDRNSLGLRGHTSYVQGVAWDPMNQMVVTQSADRSCRIHLLKSKEGVMVKLAPKGHSVIKMIGNQAHSDNSELKSDIPLTPPRTTTGNDATPTTGGGGGRMSPTNQSTSTPNLKGVNLFADSSVATCFFRRLAFSPDGSLLITPTGIHKSSKTSTASTASSSHFATHIFHRSDLSTPIVSLVGLESPSVAIRFSPVLYQMLNSTSRPLFEGDYRMIFAVVTTTAVLIYDTQHFYPLARIDGCHLATINDVAWSSNGQTLVFCSSDGYVTFARLNDGILGQPLVSEKVPIEVKNAFPSVYLPPQIDIPVDSQPAVVESQSNGKRPREMENDAQVSSSSSSSSSIVIDKPSTTVGTESLKKKRITPVHTLSPITPSILFDKVSVDQTSVVDLTTSAGDSEDRQSSTQLPLPQVINNNSGIEKKVKKRITPVVGVFQNPTEISFPLLSPAIANDVPVVDILE